jgi:hypothetical protein
MSECQTGLPDVAAPQVVYLAPWLDKAAQGIPSYWSDCGQKLIEDTRGPRYPASRYAQILATQDGWQSWLRDLTEQESFIGLAE